MDQPTYTDADRRSTLMILRVIWVVLVVGQVCFGAVVIFSVLNPHTAGQTQLRGQMMAIATGVLIGAVGLGYFIRNQSYKKHWQGHAVTPAGFFQGNLILLAALEGSSFVTLVFVMTSGQVFPMVLPAVASLAVQCANFPTGAPMESTMPGMARDAS